VIFDGAVLDACVLYPIHLRLTLLRLGMHRLGLYRPLWSPEILAEVERTLLKKGCTTTSAGEAIARIRRAFPEAELTPPSQGLVDSMTNHPKDHHVLAAAAFAGSEAVVVTRDLKDFPADACDPLGVEILSPDDFLCTLHREEPLVVIEVLAAVVRPLTQPPLTVPELARILGRDGAPSFEQRVLTQLGDFSVTEHLERLGLVAHRSGWTR